MYVLRRLLVLCSDIYLHNAEYSAGRTQERGAMSYSSGRIFFILHKQKYTHNKMNNAYRAVTFIPYHEHVHAESLHLSYYQAQ